MEITKIKAAAFSSRLSRLRVMCVSLCVIFFFLPFTLLYFSAISPLSPRLQVQSKALCEQHRHIYSLPEFLALHFGRTFTFSTPQPLHPFLPRSLPLTHPSLLSHGCFQTDPQPMCTRCPLNSTPSPQPVTAHSSVRYRQMELLSVLVSLSLSQPLSPTLHAVYFVFLFLIPYQVKNK